jgi:hypothetical protein
MRLGSLGEGTSLTARNVDRLLCGDKYAPVKVFSLTDIRNPLGEGMAVILRCLPTARMQCGTARCGTPQSINGHTDLQAVVRDKADREDLWGQQLGRRGRCYEA